MHASAIACNCNLYLFQIYTVCALVISSLLHLQNGLHYKLRPGYNNYKCNVWEQSAYEHHATQKCVDMHLNWHPGDWTIWLDYNLHRPMIGCQLFAWLCSTCVRINYAILVTQSRDQLVWLARPYHVVPLHGRLPGIYTFSPCVTIGW